MIYDTTKLCDFLVREIIKHVAEERRGGETPPEVTVSVNERTLIWSLEIDNEHLIWTREGVQAAMMLPETMVAWLERQV